MQDRAAVDQHPRANIFFVMMMMMSRLTALGVSSETHRRAPARRSRERLAAIAAAVLVSMLIGSCGFKTPLELPKKAPASSSAP